MSTTVDNRVVEMQFDNRQFEKNVNTSLSTLDRLKQALNFDKSSKNLTNFANSAGKFNLDGIATAVDGISSRFNALGIVGITALQRITNAAITTGKNVVEALTIDPVKTGLEEYETKINAIQVIRANDHSASMEQISSALNELNTYADKTIYNFAQMTSNVGKFVAQGLGVEEAANAVKGMANLAAASGASPQDMARATYQMSQALGGVIRKIDVNSLRNANMWTTTLKDTLMDVARAENVAIDEMIEKKGTLEETLEEGWLTGEMFTKAMNIYSGVYDDAQLKAMGFNDQQIAKFQEIAKTAEEAATRVKTFSQLWDTLKENVQSGWTQSWEHVIGNFEEAQQLWTDVSNILADFTNKSADARNDLLAAWKDSGGRNYLIQAMLNSLYGLLYVVDTVKQAFSDIFPPITADRLVELTMQFRDFTRSLMLSDESAATLRTVMGGIFSIAKIGTQVISAVIGGIRGLLGVFSPITSAIGNVIVAFSSLITAYAKTGDAGNKLASGFKTVIDFIQKNFGGVIQKAADVINKFASMLLNKSRSMSKGKGMFNSITKSAEELTDKLNPLTKVIDIVKKGFDGIKKGFSAIGPGIIKVLELLGGAFDTLFNSIVNAFKNADMNTALNFVKTGLLAGLAVGLKNLVDKIASPAKTFKDLIGGIQDTLGSIGDAFESFTEKAKAGLILKIGIAVGILALALIALSGIPTGDLAKALGAITALFGELFGMLALMEKFLGDAKFKGATKIAVIMIGLSIAVSLLSGALRKLASIDVTDLGKGLLAITVLLGEMTGAVMLLGNFGGKIQTSALAMVAFAASIRILVGAVAALGQLDPEQLLKGLFAVGTLMLEISTFMMLAQYGKLGISTGLGLIAMAASLLIMEKAVEKFGALNLETIGKGLLSVGGMLLIVAGAMKLMPATLPLTATGLILVGAALSVMSKALQSFGGMSMPEIGKGLLTLAGSLVILSVALNLMTGTLGGSAALLIASAALAVLAPTLQTLGEMKLAEIGKALLTMAGAFTILGVAALVLTPLVPVILGLGAGLLLISAAVAVASVALTGLAVAFTALATAGPLAVTAITAMIPLILSSIGEGFAALIAAIAQNAVTIANGFKDILVAIVTAIGEAIPTIVNTAMQLLSALLNTFLQYVPQMVDAGLQLITGILQGIAANIQGIVEAAIDVVVNFIEGIASKLPDIIQAGFDMMISFINGLADAVRTNTQPLIDAVNNMFDAVVEAAVQFITDSVGRFIQAGKDAAAGLIEGIGSGISGVAGAAVDLGKGALKGLSDAVGWNSPWKKTLEAGEDAPKGLALGIRSESAVAEAAAAESGAQVGNAYVNSVKSKISQLDNIFGYNDILGKYNNKPKTEADYRRDHSVFRESFNDKKKDAAATKDLTDANNALAKSLGGGGGGGGGGSAGAAKSATKETKKLFDVMTDGKKVVQKFAENFGEAYKTLGYTHPLQMGQEAVTALAEKIYEASQKGKEATEDAAKTTEDKLAAMREAYIQFQDTLKSTLESQTDIFGKFSEKPSESIKDWNKNLEKQKVGIKSWEANIAALSKRVKDYDIMAQIINWGPEENARVRKMLSASDSALEHLIGNITDLDGLRENAVASAMASLANTVYEFEESSETIAEAGEATSNTVQMVVLEAGEAYSKVVDVVVGGNEEMVASAQNFAKFTEEALYAAADNYLTVRDSVAEAVNSQLDIFSKFDDESELTGDELLENMKSQLDGVRSWGDGLSTLMERGLDEGLYKYLAEMGPKSYEYVQAFLEMSTEDLNTAGSYFAQSLTIGDELGQQLGNDFAVAGLMASQGFSTGIDQTAGTAELKQMAQNAVNSIRQELDINSPSGVTRDIGFNTSEGFAQGIAANTNAVGNIIKLASEVLTRFKASLPDSEFRAIGTYIVQGLANGISSSSYIATQAAAAVMREAIDAAKSEAGIASPSKEFAKLGMFSDEGLANGLLKHVGMVTNSATEVAKSALGTVEEVMSKADFFESQFERIGIEANRGLALGLDRYSGDVEYSANNVAENAVNSMKNVISRIADIINGEVNLDPTIRPVLDMSGMQYGSNYLDSMFGNAAYNVATGINVSNDRESLRTMIDDAVTRSTLAYGQPVGSPINMYVYAAPGQSEEEIANIVEEKLMFRINRGRAVYNT